LQAADVQLFSFLAFAFVNIRPMKQNTHLKWLGNETSLPQGIKLTRPQVQTVRFKTPDGRIIRVQRVVCVRPPDNAIGLPGIPTVKCRVGNQIVTAINRAELERKVGETLQREVTRHLAAKLAGSGIKFRF
jgi:hypothetical protein